MSNLQTAYNYFVSQGDSSAASAGIASGLFAESGINPNAVNPSSGATGIGQWLGSRLQALENMFGSNPSLPQQLSFVQSELTGSAGTGNQGGSTILSDTSSSQALSDFITKFERPRAGSETSGDISRGNNALSQLNTGSTSSTPFPNTPTGNFQLGVNTLANNPGLFFSTLFGGSVTLGDVVSNGVTTSANLAGNGMNTVTGNIAGQVAAGVSQGTKPLTDWLSGLTSSTTITRISIGFVALLLLAAGIFFLSSGSKQPIINIASLKGAT